MADTIRLPDELGRLLKTQREAAGLSKKELAQRAGKVREVIYRLEDGDDVTVSSLLAVLSGLGLGLGLGMRKPVDLPTMVRRRLGLASQSSARSTDLATSIRSRSAAMRIRRSQELQTHGA